MNKIAAATVPTEPERLPARRASDVGEPARAERRDALLRFLADPPPHVAEAALAVREAEEQYGGDTPAALSSAASPDPAQSRAPTGHELIRMDRLDAIRREPVVRGSRRD